MRPRSARRRGDDGAATVLTLLLLGLVLLVGAAAVAASSLVASQRTAQAGADLAALAGARAAQDGAAPCEVAAVIARRNRTALTGCEVRGFEVRVVVTVATARLPGGPASIRARARAGPVSLLDG